MWKTQPRAVGCPQKENDDYFIVDTADIVKKYGVKNGRRENRGTVGGTITTTQY